MMRTNYLITALVAVAVATSFWFRTELANVRHPEAVFAVGAKSPTLIGLKTGDPAIAIFARSTCGACTRVKTELRRLVDQAHVDHVTVRLMLVETGEEAKLYARSLDVMPEEIVLVATPPIGFTVPRVLKISGQRIVDSLDDANSIKVGFKQEKP